MKLASIKEGGREGREKKKKNNKNTLGEISIFDFNLLPDKTKDSPKNNLKNFSINSQTETEKKVSFTTVFYRPIKLCTWQTCSKNICN